MSKFVIILLVASFAACINADDNPEDYVRKFMDNTWGDVVQPAEQTMDMGENFIKTQPGMPNGITLGTFKSIEHHTKTENGKTVLDEGSSKMITNNNGTVSETDSSQ